MSKPRVFARIPERETLKEGWKDDPVLRQLAEHARNTVWGLQPQARRILGLCVMLEEAELLIEHLEQKVAAQETVINEQAARIKGLEMTIGRMKKRKEAVSSE